LEDRLAAPGESAQHLARKGEISSYSSVACLCLVGLLALGAIEGQDRGRTSGGWWAAFVAALAGFAACYVGSPAATGKVSVTAGAAVNSDAAPAGAGNPGGMDPAGPRPPCALGLQRLLRPRPVMGARTVVPGQSGKTNQVEHIPLGAGRWGNQAEKEIQAYANRQGPGRRISC
jgi:hypothetical protein